MAAEFKASTKGEGANKVLVLEIPMGDAYDSASGKTTVVASTHGNVPTTVQHGGKAVIVGVNAYIRK